MYELKFEQVGDASMRPICPHCDQKIDGAILYFEQAPNVGGMQIGKTARLFACPHCYKVLGIGPA
jgi:hypothetical protein